MIISITYTFHHLSFFSFLLFHYLIKFPFTFIFPIEYLKNTFITLYHNSLIIIFNNKNFSYLLNKIFIINKWDK